MLVTTFQSFLNFKNIFIHFFLLFISKMNKTEVFSLNIYSLYIKMHLKYSSEFVIHWSLICWLKKVYCFFILSKNMKMYCSFKKYFSLFPCMWSYVILRVKSPKCWFVGFFYHYNFATCSSTKYTDKNGEGLWNRCELLYKGIYPP